MKNLVVTKGGLQLGVVAEMAGGTKLLRICGCQSCAKMEKFERFKLLPCGCHGLIVECTCRIREKACRSCGRIFVASKPYSDAHGQRQVDVYEVEDPHGANAVL